MKKEKKETKELTHLERVRSALNIPPPEQEPPLNEFLDIENARTGLKINLWSATKDMDYLMKLSKEIKKEFFD